MGSQNFLSALALVSSLLVVGLANEVIVDIYWITPNYFMENVQSKFVSSLSSVATSHCNSTSISCGSLHSKNVTAMVHKVVQSEAASSDTSITVTVGENTEYLSTAVLERIIVKNRDKLNTDTNRLIHRVGANKFRKPADPNNWVIVAIIIVLTLILLGVVVYLSKHKVDHMAERLESKADEDEDDTNTNL